jgi:hypothetical protein
LPALRNPQRECFARLLAEAHVKPSSSPVQAAYERAGYRPDPGNCYRLANHPEVPRRVRELTAEALEYADIRIASANITDFYEPDGRFKDIATLPDRLAEAVREVEYNHDGMVRNIELRDELGALAVLIKHLGGLPDERPVNNTQVNVITDEQRIVSLLARAEPSGENGAW